MQYRQFGKTGIRVSIVGFGGSRLGGVFRSGGRNDAVKLLQAALDAGINFYDTADIYSQGENESLIGRAFRDRRDKVVIATKGGYCLPAQRKLIARIKPLVKPVARMLGIKRQSLPSSVTGTLTRQDFSPAYLTEALEASLKRLGTDHVDLYQLHSPPAEIVESGDFLEPLMAMQRAGKLRRFGVAADTVREAILALRFPEVASVQFPFGLLDLEALDELLPLAGRRGAAVIARGCFGGGLLKESLTEAALREQTPKWPRILAYRATAREMGRPLLAAALQFSLFAPAVSVTLLGMRTDSHLAENLQFLNAAPLTHAEYDQLVAGDADAARARTPTITPDVSL